MAIRVFEMRWLAIQRLCGTLEPTCWCNGLLCSTSFNVYSVLVVLGMLLGGLLSKEWPNNNSLTKKFNEYYSIRNC